MQLDRPGGTPGGIGLFLMGAGLALISAWFFVDSVRVVSGGFGWISRGAGLGADTGSIGILFLPFVIAVGALFYDASKAWAWGLFGISLLIIVVEVLSRMRFFVDLKLSHLLLMLGSFAAGCGLMLRSLRELPDNF